MLLGHLGPLDQRNNLPRRHAYPLVVAGHPKADNGFFVQTLVQFLSLRGNPKAERVSAARVGFAAEMGR